MGYNRELRELKAVYILKSQAEFLQNNFPPNWSLSEICSNLLQGTIENLIIKEKELKKEKGEVQNETICQKDMDLQPKQV